MAVSHPLPDDLVELIAERFRALAEPTRIKLLDRLREGEATVIELTEAIGTTQQNVSKHLCMLQRAGVLARRKHGNYSYYRILDEGVYSLCEAVCEASSSRSSRFASSRERGGLMLELYQTVPSRSRSDARPGSSVDRAAVSKTACASSDGEFLTRHSPPL